MTAAELGRWKRAVVHLECATETESSGERFRRFAEHAKEWRELWERVQRGEMTQEQFAEEQMREWEAPREYNRYQGTAVFLVHEDRHYFITARHVVHNTDEANAALRDAEREIEERKRRGPPKGAPPGYIDPYTEGIAASARRRASTEIFMHIFRVRSVDEMLSGASGNVYDEIRNIGAGGYGYDAQYTFSEGLDLAVLSLESVFDRPTAKLLLARGYQPIALEDIAIGPSREGSDIFTVGFPSATAVVPELQDLGGMSHIASGTVSSPAFAFGRVSMLHAVLPYFWCDMSIAPGNSGGPVIENGKLVGIVSGQPTIATENALIDTQGNELPFTVLARAPYGLAIKGQHVLALLEEQFEKDRRRAADRQQRGMPPGS